jgi:hypothetical protein
VDKDVVAGIVGYLGYLHPVVEGGQFLPAQGIKRQYHMYKIEYALEGKLVHDLITKEAGRRL